MPAEQLAERRIGGLQEGNLPEKLWRQKAVHHAAGEQEENRPAAEECHPGEAGILQEAGHSHRAGGDHPDERGAGFPQELGGTHRAGAEQQVLRQGEAEIHRV